MKCNINNTEKQHKKPYNQIPQTAHYWLCCTKDLTPKEKELMNFVFFRTYGFHRKSTRMSSRFVNAHMGTNYSNVNKLFTSLEQKGFLDIEIVHNTRIVTLCESRYKLKQKQHDDYDSGVVSTPSVKRGSEYPESGVVSTPRKVNNTIKENSAEQEGFVEHSSYPILIPLSEEKRNHRQEAYKPSSLELKFINGMRGWNIPLPVAEHNDGSYFIDFCWPDSNVALEIQGGSHIVGDHHSAAGRMRDAQKAEWLALGGWKIVYADSNSLNDPGFFVGLRDFISGESSVVPGLVPSDSTSSSEEFPWNDEVF